MPLAQRTCAVCGMAFAVVSTILADDLEEQVAQLAARGLPVGPIEVIAGSARKAVISDPEGNSITFGQPLP